MISLELIRRRLRPLGKEAVWVTIGLAVQVVGQTGTLKLVTTLLSRDDYGVVVLANSASALLQLAVFGAIVHGMMRAAPDLLRVGAVDLLKSATAQVARKPWVIVGLASAIVMVLAYATHHESVALVVPAALALTYADYRASRTQVMAQVARLRALVAGHRATESAARCLVVVATLAWLPRAAVALSAFAAASLAVNAYFERRVTRVLRSSAETEKAPLPDTRTIASEMASFALPLAMASTLTWANTSADRWLVEHVGSLGDAAVYAAAGQVGIMPFSILASLMQAFAVPILYGRSKRGDASSMEMVSWLGLLYVLGAAAMWVPLVLLRAPVVHLMLGAPLWGAADLLPLTATGWALFQLSQMFCIGPMVAGDTRKLLVPTMLAAAAAVATNVVLTPRFGARGAAWALIGSGLTRSLAMFVANRSAARSLQSDVIAGGEVG